MSPNLETHKSHETTGVTKFKKQDVQYTRSLLPMLGNKCYVTDGKAAAGSVRAFGARDKHAGAENQVQVGALYMSA